MGMLVETWAWARKDLALLVEVLVVGSSGVRVVAGMVGRVGTVVAKPFVGEMWVPSETISTLAEERAMLAKEGETAEALAQEVALKVVALLAVETPVEAQLETETSAASLEATVGGESDLLEAEVCMVAE